MKNTLFSTVFILLFFFAAVSAQENGEVLVNGTVVIRLAPEKGVDIRQKAEAVTARIEEKIQGGARAREITVKPYQTVYAVYWGTTLLVVVDKVQASANSTTALLLARRWAANIASAVGDKPLRLSRDNLSMPVGTEQRIQMSGGLKSEQPRIISCDSSIADASVDSENGDIVIRARSAGSARVVVGKGKERDAIRVFVKDWAGKILPPVEKVVTGDPTPPEVLLEAALTGINEGVSLNPGSQVSMKEYPRILTSLKSGYDQTVSIPVTIEGKGYFTVEGAIKVILRNKEILLHEPSVLMISNRPEELEEDGILFQGTVTKESPARIMYSHKNSSPFKRKLWITFRNPKRKPLRLFVAKAYGGPDKYEIQAGHKAALRYLDMVRTKAGYIIELAPGAFQIFDEYDMPSNFTLSGLCDLQVLEGDALEVEVKNAENPRNTQLKLLQEPFDPFKIHPHGIFPTPQIEIARQATLPNESLNIEVGKWPWLIDSTTGEPNTGNYGVLYTIKVHLVNRDDSAVKATVSFVPLNGTSMGTFIIDGKLYETGVVRQQENFPITEIELSPREERNVEIVTFPEASSCYPVNIKIGVSGSIR
ncbi:MAG: hypothetical protein AB2L14_30775 [Candidatus Xenobiia bacterium LiM19]